MRLLYILLFASLAGIIVVFGLFISNFGEDIANKDNIGQNPVKSKDVNEIKPDDSSPPSYEEFISYRVERPYDSCVLHNEHSEESGICDELKRIKLLSLQKPIYFFNSDSKISKELNYEPSVYSMSLDFSLFNNEDAYWNFVNTTFIERSSIYFGDATILATTSPSQAKNILNSFQEKPGSISLVNDNRIIKQIDGDNIGLFFIINNYIYVLIVDSENEDNALDVIKFLLEQ